MATQAIAAGPAPLDFTVCIKLSGGIRTEHPAVPQHPSLQAFMEEAGRVFKDATSRVERYFYEPVVSIFELAQIGEINGRFFHPVHNPDLTDAMYNPGVLADAPNDFRDIFDPATQGILIHLEAHQGHIAGIESVAAVATGVAAIAVAIVTIVKRRALRRNRRNP